MKEQQLLQIICLQTYLTQYHYQSYPILKEYLRNRIKQQCVSYPAIVILPECVGIWLYLMCVPMPTFLRNYFFNYQNIKSNRHILFIIYSLAFNIKKIQNILH